jgi:hypothetical protein
LADLFFMSLLSFARKAAVCLCWGLALGIPVLVSGQTNYYTTNGTEYAIAGSLPGDQVFPEVAVTPAGGFVVWQDNITDGDGWGISAMRLDGTLSGSGSSFRVNVQGAGDQENPHVALLKNGGAAFVWQGGQKGFQSIYARFLTTNNTWLTTNDVLVSTLITNVLNSYTTNYITNITTITITNWNRRHTEITGYTTTNIPSITTTVTTNASGNALNFQIDPEVAVLNNSNVVIVWSSCNEVSSNSMQDVYGQLFSPTGQKIGGEFLINQFTSYNQRSPSIAALKNGGFVVAWVSEQERTAFNLGGINNTNGTAPAQIGSPSVDIYARLYNSSGVAPANEFPVNTDSKPCANPAVAAASDGSFMVAWGARDIVNTDNSWDIYARPFSSAGVGGTAVRVNTHVYGDQYAPRISSIGTDYLIVWTSLGQDGSREGVFGQFMQSDTALTGGEFCVNTTTLGQQMQPAIASDGAGRFLAVWTGSTFGPTSMDLFAQRYANVSAILQPMAAPVVYAPFVVSNGVYQPRLAVSWPPVVGLQIFNYEIYVDGATTPMAVVTTDIWTMTAANGLTNSATHSFQVDYVTMDGRRSPLSPSAIGTTWKGDNYYGIPFEWMEDYYGMNFADWPTDVNAPLTSGGPTLLQVFLSGGNPLDSGTWLRMALVNEPDGSLRLAWNPIPGFRYQVQVTTNFALWNDLGSPRFAAGNNDSIFVGKGSGGYYRVVLLRQ